MADLFTPEQVGQMGLIAAVMSDEAAKKRLLALFEESGKLQAARDAFAKDQSEAAATIAEARRVRNEADMKLAGIVERERHLDERQHGMDLALDEFRKQRATFDEGRAIIDQQQKLLGSQLDKLQIHLTDRTREVTQRETIAAQREIEANGLKETYELKHARLAEALAANAQ